MSKTSLELPTATYEQLVNYATECDLTPGGVIRAGIFALEREKLRRRAEVECRAMMQDPSYLEEMKQVQADLHGIAVESE